MTPPKDKKNEEKSDVCAICKRQFNTILIYNICLDCQKAVYGLRKLSNELETVDIRDIFNRLEI